MSLLLAEADISNQTLFLAGGLHLRYLFKLKFMISQLLLASHKIFKGLFSVPILTQIQVFEKFYPFVNSYPCHQITIFRLSVFTSNCEG